MVDIHYHHYSHYWLYSDVGYNPTIVGYLLTIASKFVAHSVPLLICYTPCMVGSSDIPSQQELLLGIYCWARTRMLQFLIQQYFIPQVLGPPFDTPTAEGL